MIEYHIITASSIEELILKVNIYMLSNPNTILSGGVYSYIDRLDRHFCQSVGVLSKPLRSENTTEKGFFTKLFCKK